MKIIELSEVVLPPKEVPLETRIEELRGNVNISIYGRNFIPFQLQATVGGVRRKLAVITFERPMRISLVQFLLKWMPRSRYQEARIEDFLSLAATPSIPDNIKAIVCSGASFEMSTANEGVVPYLIPQLPPEEFDAGKPHIGLASRNTILDPGAGILLVHK